MSKHTEKAASLLKQMTLDEKTAQLVALWATVNSSGELRVKNLRGLQSSHTSQSPFEYLKDGIGHITRPLGSHPVPPRQGIDILNSLQYFLVTKTRLGIPAIPHEECLAGLMAQKGTLFPAGINNGALWDPDLVERIAAAIGEELTAVGSRQGLAPVLDVCRDARWGRTEECFGEDPYLVGSLASAYIRGFQGPDRRRIATLKHYVGHSFSEGGRNHAPVRIGPRELADTFMLPFEMGVTGAGAGSVMPAYHDLDGVPLHQSKYHLTTILRDQWGFDGTIVSDYEGISQLSSDHKTQLDDAESAAAALNAGVDLELPCDSVFRHGIPEALKRGILDMATLDAAVLRVLTEKSRLGLFEHPYTDPGAVVLNSPEHRALAREAAVKSMVLLKNDGVLPLSSGNRVGKIALIGPLADEPLAMLSGYSFPVHLILSEGKEGEGGVRTLLSEFTDRFGGNLSYARGCDILTGRPDTPAVFPGDLIQDGRSQHSYISQDESRISEAEALARSSDTVILAIGDLPGLFLSGTVGEGSDVSTLDLPGVQNRLLDAILDTGKPVIVLLYSGRPYNLGRGFQEAAAILQGWLPGEGGASASADLLLGLSNPGGKLPVSIPRNAGAMPYFYNGKMKSAGTPIQSEYGAVFPFGFGLSFTEFGLEDFSLAEKVIPVDGEIRVRCTVLNRGDRAGEEVVQVYIRDRNASMVRPVMELKAYRRIGLQPGESAVLEFAIPTDMLHFTGLDGIRVIEPGVFDIMIGTSSRDIRFRDTVELTGEVRPLPKRWRMYSQVCRAGSGG